MYVHVILHDKTNDLTCTCTYIHVYTCTDPIIRVLYVTGTTELGFSGQTAASTEGGGAGRWAGSACHKQPPPTEDDSSQSGTAASPLCNGRQLCSYYIRVLHVHNVHVLANCIFQLV